MKIEIRNLEKTYAKNKVLSGIDLSMDTGAVHAVMGPNGSGKSTLMKCILGLVNADHGKILINGENVINEWKYRNYIGYMPQAASYPGNISIAELIDMICDIRGEKGNAGELLEVFQLSYAVKKKIKELSGGMKQKLNAITALMFDSPILIFDEPTAALDPVSRIILKEQILKEKRKGKTILLTTHYMNEVEELADDIVFLLDGKIFYHGTIENLMEENHEKNLERAVARILQNVRKEVVQ